MSFKSKSAEKPEAGGLQYHIRLKKGDIPPYVLIPGDPGRVNKIVSLWDKSREVANYRQYHTMKGTYKGTKLACISSGIGSPGLLVAMEELLRIGVHTFIRVGTCGGIQPDTRIGDLVISTGAVRLDGASKDYAMIEYPAVADYRVVNALVAAAKKLKIRYHVGITASTDTFYAGQGRPGFKDYLPSHKNHILEDLQKANVKNFEMEAASLFTLAGIFNVMAGAVCVVITERKKKGELRLTDAMEKKVGLVASEAIRILSHE